MECFGWGVVVFIVQFFQSPVLLCLYLFMVDRLALPYTSMPY